MKFSIIVPVYNSEKYLPKCLDSVIGQTYKDIEIICVNDGSRDSSLQILYEYAQKDNRIKVINQENQGVSVARNVGIDNAIGDFLLFVDSDDWVSENLCAAINEHVMTENFDVLFFNYYNCSQKNQRPINCIEGVKKRVIIPGLWNKAYRREFILRNGITFPQGITMAEDMIFVLKVLSKTKAISLESSCLYYYRNDNKDSATHTNNKYINEAPYKYWFNCVEYKNMSKQDKLATLDFFAVQIFAGWSTFYSKDTAEQNNKIINEFLEYYKQFDCKDYKNLIGYKRLKNKEVWRFLKNIRNLIFKIIYKKRSV